jgi:hypothetical protein
MYEPNYYLRDARDQARSSGSRHSDRIIEHRACSRAWIERNHRSRERGAQSGMTKIENPNQRPQVSPLEPAVRQSVPVDHASQTQSKGIPARSYLSLRCATIIYQFGEKRICSVPDSIVKSLNLTDGKELEATITEEGGILLSLKGTPRIVSAD